MIRPTKAISPQADWLIYALGGGFGHLTRAVALARVAFPRAGILTNSPYTDCVRNALSEVDIVSLRPSMTAAEARAEVPRHINQAAPQCLIVDTFPRGLVGELVDVLSAFHGPKVLVQRDLNPAYVAAYRLDAFVANSYDLVLDAGDSSSVPPWLVRSTRELLSRDRARALLELHDDKPCAMVCAAGNPEELAWYDTVVAGLLEHAGSFDVRCIAPRCPDGCPATYWRSYWPAIDLFAAADVVIGGAGYNIVHECLACDVPLLARPWPRTYDRQRLRAERAACNGAVFIVDRPEQAIAAALRLLRGVPRPRRVERFQNGAGAAVEQIEQLLHQTSACSIYSV